MTPVKPLLPVALLLIRLLPPDRTGALPPALVLAQKSEVADVPLCPSTSALSVMETEPEPWLVLPPSLWSLRAKTLTLSRRRRSRR
jgi:hypothetical protein